ncbi:hypothetical protein [Siccirubricoccus phaeus]
MTTLLRRWRDDPGATYRSWFLWEERVKNFRSIRRGIQQVVADIKAGTFGVAYRGSSLETVVHSIAEQRQIFKGADHAFLWKPKLRIPDIYENPDNQRAFGACSTPASAARRSSRSSPPSARSTPGPSRASARRSPTCSTSSTRPSCRRSTRPSSTATTS